MNRSLMTALLAAATITGGGCQDLVVDNTNSPDRNRALAQPDAVELLAASTFPNLYNRLYRGTAGYTVLPKIGDETTNTDNASGSRDLSTLPRRPYDNNPVNDDQYALVEVWWADPYESFSNATDALRVIDDGLVIETGSPAADNTFRLRVFAKVMQGISLGYLGLLFDQAYAYDETTPIEVIEDPIAHNFGLKPYPEVIAKAISLLDEGVALAASGPDFTIPSAWLYTAVDVSKADLIQMAHGYAARFRVLAPRTPEERATVDWQAVINSASKVTKNVSVLLGANNTGRNANYVRYSHSTSDNSRMYAAYGLIGPADVSGNYQTWLQTSPPQRTRFLITTPDRRITGAGGPTTNGRYFRYVSTNLVNPLYGTYRESFYQWARYAGPINNAATSGNYTILSLDEMKLYIAEAHYRLNNLQQAVDIINATRVANGSLPPITTAGVPQSATCVPRTNSGDCGSLLDALVYERMIELSFLDPIRTWADKRGFGRLTTGTMLHLPIPYEQQRILDMPYYTFGGSGPGSAQ
jgi:hypothetical protein